VHDVIYFKLSLVVMYVIPAINFLCSCCQNGLATKAGKSRKQIKERKNRSKKIRGVKKVSSYDDTGTLQSLYAVLALSSTH
jgi:hypothetical protein